MSLRVVHYLNQFFGGLGGEDAANLPIQVRDGAVGPGRVLQAALGDAATNVGTIIGGDNYVVEQPGTAAATIRAAFATLRPDVVVAGPAFDAGRYGLGCALVCRVAQEGGIPAVTAMYPDSPGFATYRRDLICVPTGVSVAEMTKVMPALARLALKLGRGEELGPADEEGYLWRGFRQPIMREKTGAARAVDMAVARAMGRPVQTEIPVATYDSIAPAPPVADLSHIQLAVVTSGGLVPKGNPDRLVAARAEQFFRYSIEGRETLAVGEWESVHGGYSTRAVNTHNPNYVVPLDILRELEAAHRIGSLYPVFFATVGAQTSEADAKRMGAEIAGELVREKVGAVLLVAT